MQPEQLNLNTLLKTLTPRARDAHKGDFGHVLIVGGDYGYPGAPIMAALGALRVGCGLVTVATHKQNLYGLNAYHPEIMHCDIDSPAAIENIANKATVIVLGPGLGRSAWSQDVYNHAIKQPLKKVLDADALYFLARSPVQYENMIITPHPGEAKTLLEESATISDRINCVNTLVDKYNCTVVLKGAGTLVASPGAQPSICGSGNPGMASGGMGDLLSGIIAGLLAQDLGLYNAAKLGVILHATAGDRASDTGQRGLLATDLLPYIRELIG